MPTSGLRHVASSGQRGTAGIEDSLAWHASQASASLICACIVKDGASVSELSIKPCHPQPLSVQRLAGHHEPASIASSALR